MKELSVSSLNFKQDTNNDFLWGYITASVLRLSSAFCVYPDDKCENVTFEVVLLGVEKKDVSLKISDSGFYIRAREEGVEYTDGYAFCCPVEPEKPLAN